MDVSLVAPPPLTCFRPTDLPHPISFLRSFALEFTKFAVFCVGLEPVSCRRSKSRARHVSRTCSAK